MSNIAISFEHVSKMYQLGVVGTGTISNDLKRWWNMSVLGKEDPFLKIGQTNDRASKSHGDYVYALRDIDFKVEQGDVVGIIGKNGAGKSTLLKLLSRITAPTTGYIKAKGRIASLLEVGTGFHPELTGRENIYLNGSIMGMTKKEIDAKLDEIVDFSGCEMYIDTPCKRYSSGMQVRLGFAVAAFLEPEILVVDEVLAVGDAEFQKKAIGKMQDVSQGQGRTVLFVSHNMNSVKMLCKHGVVLKNGMVDMIGTAEDCVDHYLDNASCGEVVSRIDDVAPFREKYEFLNYDITFQSVRMNNTNASEIALDETLQFQVRMKNTGKFDKFQLCVFFLNMQDVRVAFYQTDTIQIPNGKTEFDLNVQIPNHSLPKGRYKVRFEANYQDFSKGSTHFDFIGNCLSFEVKYIHQEKKDEFLFWSPNFGETLHVGNQIIATIE